MFNVTHGTRLSDGPGQTTRSLLRVIGLLAEVKRCLEHCSELLTTFTAIRGRKCGGLACFQEFQM